MVGEINTYFLKDKNDWNRLLNRMWQTDFYFTPDYHALSITDDNIPFLFYYTESDYQIIIPLILRKIPDCEYFDVTSVYGYAGPLSSHRDVPIEVLRNFKVYFREYLIQNKVISVFNRLHPFIKNERYLYDLEEIVSLNQTVYIDLKVDPSKQLKQYRKGVKSDISKLKKEGYEIFEDTHLSYLDTFMDIYNENMRRVNADDHYFFSPEYYHDFFSSKEINARLFFVKKDDKLIAGSIFTFVDRIIQYHLSGTNQAFLKNSPLRLLIDYIRQLGKESDFSILHLGGGVGSSNDSLFSFKTGFSKSRLDFKVWRYIIDHKVYNDLVKINNIDENQNYFPLYRANKRQL